MPDLQQCERISESNSPIRGLRLFRAIGRKLARTDKKRKSSSGDESSCSSNRGQEGRDHTTDVSSRVSDYGSDSEDIRRSHKTKHVTLSLENSCDTVSEPTSNSGSDTSAILSKVLKKLTISSSRKRKSPPQKSILRRPPCHIYVRGISGLPTQRVPVSRGYYRNPHRSSIQYTGSYPRNHTVGL